MVMVQTPSRVQTIGLPHSQINFEEANNFQKALVKRDQNVLQNKKEEFQVNTN